jgi:hypothetical protein
MPTEDMTQITDPFRLFEESHTYLHLQCRVLIFGWNNCSSHTFFIPAVTVLSALVMTCSCSASDSMLS